MDKFLILLCLNVWTLSLVIGHVVNVTKSLFHEEVTKKQGIFLYVTKDDCEQCEIWFSKFIITAQTFDGDSDLLFGRVSDPELVLALEVTDFPEVVYYNSGSPEPMYYDGDFAPDALVDLVVMVTAREDDAAPSRRYCLELTEETADSYLGLDSVSRLVMLHETSDTRILQTYEKFAKVFANDVEVLIMRLDVDKFPALRTKFLTRTYPAFYWYEKGDRDKKKKYGGVFHMHPMIEFVNERSGTARMEDGTLLDTAGRIATLDEIISDRAGDLHNVIGLDKLYRDLQVAVQEIPGQTELPKYYLHLVAEVAAAGTTTFLREETSRLLRARQNDELGPVSRDLLTKKLNIVAMFENAVDKFLLAQMLPGNQQLADGIIISNSYKKERISPFLHDEM